MLLQVIPAPQLLPLLSRPHCDVVGKVVLGMLSGRPKGSSK